MPEFRELVVNRVKGQVAQRLPGKKGGSCVPVR